VAYAEKRGKGPQPWRVKYKLPNGTQASESGFETKAAALTRGRDQEARIRDGRWTDPNAGKVTTGEWIERWLAMQDVGLSTRDNRDYMIRRFIRPAWGDTPLNSLCTEDITRWENGLPARAGISPRTARAARSLLGTILGDAAAAKPPLLPYNPALQPRAAAPQPRPPYRQASRTRWRAARLGHPAAGPAARRAGRAAVRPRRGLHPAGHHRLHRPALGRGNRPGTRPGPPGRDPRRMAATRTQRRLSPAPA